MQATKKRRTNWLATPRLYGKVWLKEQGEGDDDESSHMTVLRAYIYADAKQK